MQGPLSNQKLGNKYLLGELLGQGGFGEVYKAQNLLLNRLQAIKVILERHFIDPRFRERFIREAQTLASLNHPNILPVYDFEIEGDRAYLVMPFISGGTLQSILKQKGLLKLEETEFYLKQICGALDYAHSRNVVHLDLKPLNLLHQDGTLLLSDFGLAHLMKEGAVEGGTSLRFGSPHYMAPEHLRGQPQKRSDVYALGIILYQMLVGRVPFTGKSAEEIMLKQLMDPPPPIRVSRPDLPVPLEVVLEKSLTKKPEERYATAGKLLEDFQAALSTPIIKTKETDRPTIDPTVYQPPRVALAPTEYKSPIIPIAPVKSTTPVTPATPIPSSDERSSQGMLPIVLSSMLGTAIEWYDFFLYGTIATLVFPRLFFPQTDSVVGTLLALFTFLVGFIARPVGGAFFGHLGDRIGRKSTLIATLLLMGISTLLIGFLPGYATLGVAAALILVLLRLGQGLGVGGEWGGSVLLALEYGHKSNRGFWASWPQMGVPVGLIASTIVVNIVQATTGSAFFDWGWRIPFFLSALLILVGLYIRLRILETPLFAKVKEQKREARAPILDAFRHSTPEILLSAGARFVEQAPFYLFTVFVITYGISRVHIGRGTVLNAITIGAIVELFTIPLFGYLSDRVGRRIWYLIGCVLMAAFAFPYFMLMNAGNAVLFSLAIILSLTLFHAWVYGPQAALIAERFGTRSRYSGASLGYQLAAPFAGGLAPIIALLLLNGKTNLSALGLSGVVVNIGAGSWQAVSVYIIVLAVISFVSVLGLKELTRADISDVEAYRVEAVPLTAQD